jgi:hypothetical protein
MVVQNVQFVIPGASAPHNRFVAKKPTSQPISWKNSFSGGFLIPSVGKRGLAGTLSGNETLFQNVQIILYRC